MVRGNAEATAPQSPSDQSANGDRNSLASFIERTLDLPTMPTIAVRVIKAVDDPNTSALAMAKIIEVDQGISARILRVCNSAMFGLRSRVNTVQHAVTILGLRELKYLVVSASNRYLYKRFGPREQRMWEHSMGCGIGVRMIAERFAPDLRDIAFLAGQMHDVGKVIMNNHNPSQYEKVENNALDVGTCSAEQLVFGFSHSDVGSIIMQRWNMPASIEAAAFYHHDLMLCEAVANEHARLTACVALGDYLCHLKGIGSAESKEDQALIDSILVHLPVPREKLDELAQIFFERFQTEKSSLL